MCWPSSAKYMPSISTEPPGPENSAVASWRTTSPPMETATWRRVASRPTFACWVEWCTASSAQSWTVTTVSSAPSPTTISTFSTRVAVPWKRSTTVDFENAPARTTRWPAEATSFPVPVSVTVVASSPTCSLGTSTRKTDSDAAQARALPRSGGTTPAVQRGDPPRRLAARGDHVVGEVEGPLRVQVAGDLAGHLLGGHFERLTYRISNSHNRLSSLNRERNRNSGTQRNHDEPEPRRGRESTSWLW